MSKYNSQIHTTLERISSLITSGSRGWADYYSEKGALFLRMTNLPKEGIGLLLHDNKYVTLPSSSSEGKRTKVQRNDILISITAELGKIGFVETDLGEAYVNQHIALVRISSFKVHPKFLAYYLSEYHQRNLWQRLNDSGAKSGLNLQTIKKYPVNLPPLKQQIDIAGLLSTWDQAIEKTERLIAAKDKRFSWLLKKLINQKSMKSLWRKLKLRELVEKSKGKSVTLNDEKRGAPYIGSNSFEGKFTEYTESTNAVCCNHDDILLLWDGEYAGKVTTGLQGVVGSTVMKLSPFREIDSTFLCYHILANNYRIRAIREGSGVPHIPGDFLDWYIMVLPPLEKQKQITSILNTARREIDLLKKQAEAYHKQKRGLMQKLLTGKWRVEKKGGE